MSKQPLSGIRDTAGDMLKLKMIAESTELGGSKLLAVVAANNGRDTMTTEERVKRVQTFARGSGRQCDDLRVAGVVGNHD